MSAIGDGLREFIHDLYIILQSNVTVDSFKALDVEVALSKFRNVS